MSSRFGPRARARRARLAGRGPQAVPQAMPQSGALPFAGIPRRVPVAVVVGNGLTIDYRSLRPDLTAWDTQRPLTWNVPTPGVPGTPLVESLPALRQGLADASVTALQRDFDKIAALSRLADAWRQAGRKTDGDKLEFQLRLYLLFAYATFQQEVDKGGLQHWAWSRWFAALGPRLRALVSFNYDLIAETAVNECGTVPATPFLKPHGSIDFEYDPSAFVPPPLYFPLGHYVLLRNDAPMVRLPRHKLLSGRRSAELILPAEYSHMTDFRWVREGYELIEPALADAGCLVIAGLSYWKEDRVEIDRLIEALPRGALVVIANPYPPPELETYLARSRRPFTIWREKRPPPLG